MRTEHLFEDGRVPRMITADSEAERTAEALAEWLRAEAHAVESVLDTAGRFCFAASTCRRRPVSIVWRVRPGQRLATTLPGTRHGRGWGMASTLPRYARVRRLLLCTTSLPTSSIRRSTCSSIATYRLPTRGRRRLLTVDGCSAAFLPIFRIPAPTTKATCSTEFARPLGEKPHSLPVSAGIYSFSTTTWWLTVATVSAVHGVSCRHGRASEVTPG